MIGVERFMPAQSAEWDSLVGQAIQGHFMFERNFIDYHGDRFEDHSLLFRHNTRLLAVLPAHRIGPELCSHQGLPFAGLLWIESVHLDVMGEIVGALVDYMARAGFSRLVYSAVPAPYKRHPCDDDIYQLEQLGATLSETRVACAARIGSLPTLSRTRLQLVQRARRNGLGLQRNVPVRDAYDVIARFLRTRFDRQPVHSLDELELLMRRFPDQIRCDGVLYEGALVHTAIAFESQTCLRLQYSAGSERSRELNASDYLFASLLAEPGMQGRWLDFGTSMDPVTGKLRMGLHRYKESFGGRTSLLRTYMLDLLTTKPVEG